MKEIRYFYDPQATAAGGTLPDDEAAHALRVLRLHEGDTINVTDGRGHLYEATIAEATKRACRYIINKVEERAREWPVAVHLAVAPTKNIDRMEWLVEKATEIGVDSITFLDCQFSERRVVKTDRLDKIAVAAMKQSHKFHKPQINDIVPFREYVESHNVQCSKPQAWRGLSLAVGAVGANFAGKPESEAATFNIQPFIAHCYEDADLLLNGEKPFLLDAIKSSPLGGIRGGLSFNVLVGPEGDFSADEVRLALSQGLVPVSLGTARLRTETAALVAIHLMQLAQR